MTDPSEQALPGSRAALAHEPGVVPAITSTLPLAPAHQLSLRTEPERSSLAIETNDGKQVVQIELGPSGIHLQAGALTLTWDAQGGLRLQVDKLTLVGSQHVAIETEGDLTLRAGGRLTLSGADQVIAATVGDVEIRANDNVAVSGEKILLNC